MVTKSYWIIYIHWRWHGNSLTGQFINFHDREKNESRAEIKSKRASLELEEARGRRGETGKQWKWNTARGPPRGPDVPPTIAVLQVSALILEQHGSAPDSIVRTRFRDPSKNRDSTFARGQSVSQALSILFGHFFVHPWSYLQKKGERKERILREMGIVVEQECKNRFTGSSPFTRSHNRR